MNRYKNILSKFSLDTCSKFLTSKRVRILIVVSVFLLFSIKSASYIDPDMGWRVAGGQLMAKNGIPKSDPFTYTMPSFPWVDHAWSVSIAIGLLYPLIGSWGLSLIASTIALSALVLLFYGNNGHTIKKTPMFAGSGFWFAGNFIFILASSVILSFIGIRAQVVTWFLFAALISFILNNNLWEKYKYYLPVYFIIWANTHGGWAAGILALSTFVILRSVRLKKLNITEYLILILSILATLINPYGFGVWREVWSSLSDTGLRWSISEWLPAVFNFDVAFSFLLVFSCVFIYKFRKKFLLEEIGLFFVFLTQGLLSVRNVPIWLIITIPLSIKMVKHFYDEVSLSKTSAKRFTQAYRAIWVLAAVIFVFSALLNFKSTKRLNQESFYPKEAVNYLKQNTPEGEIFSDYGWGGYLIWKFPEKKVFIDGRMPSWRWKNAPAGELASAFDTYIEILSGHSNYKIIFDEQGIDTVLWASPGEKDLFGLLEEKMHTVLKKTNTNRNYNLLTNLEKDGWTKVYEDSVAVIYQKNGKIHYE
jgi:hypothetical protein